MCSLKASVMLLLRGKFTAIRLLYARTHDVCYSAHVFHASLLLAVGFAHSHPNMLNCIHSNYCLRSSL